MLHLKNATICDIKILFDWVNDVDVRKNSFNSEKISWKEHKKWIENKLNDKNTFIFIVCDGNLKVGQCRVDIKESYGLIDYSIDKKFRGNGLGKEVLNLLKENFKDIKLIGRVKYENTASLKSFEKANFKRVNKEDYVKFML